ncbi:hypothetical protein CR513_37014, partial [Mucuna pruriens]
MGLATIFHMLNQWIESDEEDVLNVDLGPAD